MKVSFAFALIVFGSIARGQVHVPFHSIANGQDGSQLLMGTLVRQGPSKHDVLQGKEDDYEVPDSFEEVKVKTIMRS